MYFQENGIERTKKPATRMAGFPSKVVKVSEMLHDESYFFIYIKHTDYNKKRPANLGIVPQQLSPAGSTSRK